MRCTTCIPQKAEAAGTPKKETSIAAKVSGHVVMSDHHSLAAGFTRALFGICLGILLYRQRTRLYALMPTFIGPLVALGICCLVLCSTHIGRFNYLADGLAIFLAFPICVLAATRTAPQLFSSAMTTLGAASYAVYLFHPLLGQAGMLVAPTWITVNASLSGVILVLVVLLLAVGIDRVDIAIRRTLNKMVFPRPAA